MTDMETSLFERWAGADAPAQSEGATVAQSAGYCVRLEIKDIIQPPETGFNKRDPLSVLEGLYLLPEDKAYIHGFIGALQLPDAYVVELMRLYRQQWELGSQRANNPNQMMGYGRRAANTWLQQGAQGYIQRTVDD